MTFLVSLKVVRLLLTVSVSLWLAGGCLLGCGSMAMAAQQRGADQDAVEAASCQSAQEHHCCSKPKPKQSTIDPKLTESFLALATLPRGPMGDCPLAMSATAIAAKASSNSPDSDQTTNAPLPLMAGNREQQQRHFSTLLVPNRGPTYLRCCVFLI